MKGKVGSASSPELGDPFTAWIPPIELFVADSSLLVPTRVRTDGTEDDTNTHAPFKNFFAVIMKGAETSLLKLNNETVGKDKTKFLIILW